MNTREGGASETKLREIGDQKSQSVKQKTVEKIFKKQRQSMAQLRVAMELRKIYTSTA